LEVSVAVDGEAAEAVCELFERHGGGAVVEVLVRNGVADGADLAVPQTRVATYIAADDAEARARLEVGLWHLGQLYPIPGATLRHLAEANWAEAWKAHYSPQRIGPFLVLPSWIEPPPGAGGLEIRLDPGMAFGTGLHPTTRLCLAALAGLVTPGATVLDVGTGSGILAIASARLGAGAVVGLDLDARAVAIAGENARRNDVAVELHAGPLASLRPGRFDVVVANILAGTLSELAPELWARTLPGGTLVASGVLAEQAKAVDAAFQGAGFAPARVQASGDWVALVARRPGAA
jgi:ribosomal protein L11 methyltransferase